MRKGLAGNLISARNCPADKAAEGRRSPRRRAFACDSQIAQIVMECASPLALSHRAAADGVDFQNELANRGLPHMIVLTCVAMKTCTYCGKQYQDEATVCVIDNQPLSPADSPSASPNKSCLSAIFSTRFCSISTSCKILCGIVFVSTLSFFPISYIGGRSGMPLSIWILPVQSVPVLLIFFSITLLLSICVVTLVKGANRRLAFSMLALSWLFLLPVFVINPARIFQIGFRQRILSTVSPAELREIARVCSTPYRWMDVCPARRTGRHRMSRNTEEHGMY